MVASVTSDLYLVDVAAVAEAVDPFLGERVVEDCASVTARACRGLSVPVDTVRRYHTPSCAVSYIFSGNSVRGTQEHLEALVRIICKMVEPYS